MKTIGRAALAVLLLAMLLPSAVAAKGPQRHQPRVDRPTVERHPFEGGVFTPAALDYAPDRVLVRFRAGSSDQVRASAASAAGANARRPFQLVPGLEAITLRRGEHPADAVVALSRNPAVEYASLDYKYTIDVVPNDPSYADQWALTKIRAATAWQRSTGSRAVKVAVLDTGADLTHPDLAPNLVPGWNFVAGTADPTDDNGHGTHVAGIIGAVGNNATGISGVNWAVSIMPLKICDAQGGCYLSHEIAALDYAVNHGAQVANASFGGQYGGWQPERDAIAAAGQHGLLFVAAAGNGSSDNDRAPFFPASYELDNIISVGATRPDDAKTDFSNFGATSVDLVAPGANILSTVPTADYAAYSGTSMAAPFVAGAAALVRALHPAWGVTRVRNRLLGTVAPVSSLAGSILSCGRLDLAAATSSRDLRASLCAARAGSGTGSVVSTPAGIDCGATCAARFGFGTKVTLTATPDPGHTFVGWSGPCTGTAPCTTTLAAATTVTATFRGQATQNGWINSPIKPPKGRPATVPGTVGGWGASFFNLSISADGMRRVKVQYTQPESCMFDTTDTGGVFIERKTASGWKSDGVLRSPRVGNDSAARWPNCFGFGSIARLSGDGRTLLVGQPMATLRLNDAWVYRCSAFIYKRTTTGWVLDGTILPPGIGPDGSAGVDGCVYFGEEGAISYDGQRVAMNAWLPGPTDANSSLRALVYVRDGTGWKLEADLATPACTNYCVIPSRGIVMSNDGATVVMSTGDDAIHTFRRTGSTWSSAGTTFSPDPNRYIWFGVHLGLSADGRTLTTTAGDYWEWYQDRSRGGVVIVYERVGEQWLLRTMLVTGRPTPNASLATFSCPAIVKGGARVVCTSYETVGFNDYQGSVYIFDRPAAGWAAGANPVRMYSADGLSNDRLGTTGPRGTAILAVPEGGAGVYATISVDNLVNGGYPNDRIGYWFRR